MKSQTYNNIRNWKGDWLFFGKYIEDWFRYLLGKKHVKSLGGILGGRLGGNCGGDIGAALGGNLGKTFEAALGGISGATSGATLG